MTIKMRAAAALMAVLAALAIAPVALAQGKYPDHPVHVLVGYPPGGPVDIIARIMSDKLAAIWGQPAVVENISGAGGNIAGDRVAKAAPDGYTLLVATNAQLAVNPSLYKMTFDPAKDLMPISLAVYSPNILVVPNDVPVKDRGGAGRLCARASGQADLRLGRRRHHAASRRRAVQVDGADRYPARALSRRARRSSPISWAAASPCSSAPSRRSIPLVREGKVRALAVTSAKRFPAAPELPTMIEAGYPGFVSVLSIGLMAPAGTPPAIIEKIHQDAVKVLAMPEVRKKLAQHRHGSDRQLARGIRRRHRGGNAAMGEGHQGRRDRARATSRLKRRSHARRRGTLAGQVD